MDKWNTVGAFVVLALLFAGSAVCQTDPGWPRTYPAEGAEVVVYQPQVEEWTDFRFLQVRAAMAVKLSGQKQPDVGALFVSARTETDFERRTVLIHDMTIREIRFFSRSESKRKILTSRVQRALPLRNMTVSLDRMLAAVEEFKEVEKPVEVSFRPPPIYYSTSRAVLLQFDGDPILKQVPGMDLMFAVNTNWDVFFLPGQARYWLRVDKGWMSAGDPLKGPWRPETAAPAALGALPAGDDWKDVRAALPAAPFPPGQAPRVFVTKIPSELILVDGEPQFIPIPGTGLLYVGNTASDIFMHGGE